jgi:sigma-B regulation protein RsbU (phosphoserine phosphatase)
MMSKTGDLPEHPTEEAAFTALLEDSAEDLYENAPCGYLSTLMDGQIAKINGTLLRWLGYDRAEVVGRMRFADLLTVGGKLYQETHIGPLLRMQGELSGIALELKTAQGARLPVLVTSTVKTTSNGEQLLIRTTIFDARDRRKYEQELLRARHAAEQAAAQARSDREAAEQDRLRLQQVLATLQSSLSPPSLPEVPGLDALAHYHTASPDDLGGDFYDLFSLADGRWAFFLGDVCGKGAEAATLTSLTRYTLRTAALHNADPVSVLTTLNTALYERFRQGDTRYCTAIVGTLTPVDDGYRVDVASGGHPPVLLLRADGSAEYLHTPEGMLVGVLAEPLFVRAGVTLGPGDTLLLYTDGLTEAHVAEGGDRYDEEALLEFASGLAPVSAKRAMAAVIDLLTGFGDGLDDDTAVLAIGVPS